ncbi:phospholipase D-like domain-containing protein [Leptolyngbya sp. FACHB-16]|uniref:phospholipase D-like domain-containing protein n=1 Tax=unclassified Leptolyngbya TaxID=2650499 RepID=UPI00321FAD3F
MQRRIENRELAQTFSREFALMWGDGVGKEPDSKFGLQKPYRGPQTVTLAPGSTVTVQFSPTSPSQNWWVSGNGLIGRTLSQAQQRIDIALFVFSDQYLSYVLEARHHEGVSVQALIDANFFSRNYSEGLDMMGVALPDDRCRIEAGNHPWNEAIASVGTPNLPDGDMLHHKFAVVDGTTVITGSQNWSASANQSNDENVLVIHNATVAAHFEREFERLYRDAALGVPLNIQEKIHEQTARCQH